MIPRKPQHRWLTIAILGVLVPFIALLAMAVAPDVLDRVSPVYSLYAQPRIDRTGNMIVFTQPTFKHHTCHLTAPIYAVVYYTDSKGEDRTTAFDLRGADRTPVGTRRLLEAGEKRVIGPYLLFVTNEIIRNATEFYVHLMCNRPLLGQAHTRLGPFKIPPNSRLSDDLMLERFGAADPPALTAAR